MKRFDIVRAMKDRSYRDGLSNDQLKHLESNPAGISELDESILEGVGGGTQSNNGCGTVGGTTFHFACRQ